MRLLRRHDFNCYKFISYYVLKLSKTNKFDREVETFFYQHYLISLFLHLTILLNQKIFDSFSAI